MASEIGLAKLIPWNGNTGSGKDNRSVIDSNFEMLESYVRTKKTPYVGENGNWWVGSVDTGVPAKGADGKDGADGADGKDGKDGEVTLEQLGVKADKSLTDSSPVTYFKSGEGGSSEIDLTTEVRASIVPFVWGAEKSWMTSNQQDNGANLALAPSTLEGQGDKRSMIKYKLKPNTWYRLAGLNSPLSYYCFEVPVDANGLAATGQPRQMLPVASLTRDGDSNNNMRANTAEWMYAGYGQPIIFKTRTTINNIAPALWLTVMVKLDDTVTMNRSAALLDYYQYPDWAFDSRDTVTLHELVDYDGSGNSNTEPVDKLVDSLGQLLKEFNFDTIVNNKLNEIKGIIAGGASMSNPNLLPDNPEIIGGFQLKHDGIALNTGGQYAYIADFIPVKPNTSYRNVASAVRTLYTDNADLRQVIFYDENKVAIPDTVTPVGSLHATYASNIFFTPSNCYFIRLNIHMYYWSGGGSSGLRKIIDRNFPTIITEESKVSLSSADLEDAKEITSGGITGITIPTLLIPKANIIEDGGSDDGFTINMRNLSTFVGSFNTAIDKIFAVQPKARHVFVGHFSYDGLNGNGWLRPMIETQRAMCKNRNIPYIDLASIMGFTFNDGNVVNVDGVDVDYNNLKSFTPDYTHPGRDASQVMANLLADRLTELLKPYVKNGEIVANIGDSVSAGYTGLPSGDTAWARYIERALFAIGCTVKRYASSGGALRATTIDQGIVNNGFMGNTDPGWNFQNHVLDKIGTSEQPNVYLWELGHNDFTADYRDFKLNW